MDIPATAAEMSPHTLATMFALFDQMMPTLLVSRTESRWETGTGRTIDSVNQIQQSHPEDHIERSNVARTKMPW